MKNSKLKGLKIEKMPRSKYALWTIRLKLKVGLYNRADGMSFGACNIGENWSVINMDDW